MASRENQTMQIFLIVLALLSLGLSVGLFMVNGSRKTAVARAKSAQEEATSSRRAQNELQSEANNYKLWIGYPEADNYSTLQTNYAEDMERWGKNFEESSRSFRNIVDNIFDENRKLAQSEADAKAQVKKLTQDLLAIETQKNEQIAKYQAESQKAQEDKARLSSTFDESRQLIDQEKDKLVNQLSEQRETLDKVNAKHGELQQTLEEKIVKLERVIEILKSNQAPTDPYAQPADGRIAWVNQREGKVWINLGEEDQLRPQVTFSVYSGDTSDVNAATSKGNIEVVRLLSAHMAEARITDDRAIRPLMEGDKVYSQVWNRGRQVGFAITGTIDLNGDTRSDLEQLKRIVLLNNGKVDAVPDGEGGIEGEMTVDTRYLILGKHPEDSRNASAAARKSFQKMSEEADTLNIEVITLEDFLSLMGWHADNRAVRVGKGARSEDFRASPNKDYQPPKVKGDSGLFRQRRPKLSY